MTDLEDYQPLKEYMNTLICSCDIHPNTICPIHIVPLHIVPAGKDGIEYHKSPYVSFCDCKVGKCSHEPISVLLKSGEPIKIMYTDTDGKERYATLKPEDR